MNRRQFLGFLGATAVIAATPRQFMDFLDSRTQSVWHESTARLVEIFASNPSQHQPVLGRLIRNNGAVLLHMPIGPQGLFRWIAPMGNEIVVPPRTYLTMESNSRIDYGFIWSINDQLFSQRGNGELIDLSTKLGARARRRRNAAA